MIFCSTLAALASRALRSWGRFYKSETNSTISEIFSQKNGEESGDFDLKYVLSFTSAEKNYELYF
jgi:hypothetical protein